MTQWPCTLRMFVDWFKWIQCPTLLNLQLFKSLFKSAFPGTAWSCKSSQGPFFLAVKESDFILKAGSMAGLHRFRWNTDRKKCKCEDLVEVSARCRMLFIYTYNVSQYANMCRFCVFLREGITIGRGRGEECWPTCVCVCAHKYAYMLYMYIYTHVAHACDYIIYLFVDLQCIRTRTRAHARSE